MIAEREISVCRGRAYQRRDGIAGGPLSFVHGPSVESDGALGRRHHPGEDAQESGLAGAIGAAQHHALAGGDLDVRRPQQPGTVDLFGDPVALQDAWRPGRLRVRSRLGAAQRHTRIVSPTLR